jgi:hypothetical protein
VPIFELTLQRTYYEKGFFNVTTDFDRFVRSEEGPVRLKLGVNGEEIQGKIDRRSNPNGTARIFGRSMLRDWFQRNFELMDVVAVDLSSRDIVALDRPGSVRTSRLISGVGIRNHMDWKQFENHARTRMSQYFGVTLTEKKPMGFPKRFDMVSPDETIVGDAKFLTLVHGQKLPPAKFMEIAGHVWLLEKTEAVRKFLVFGNQQRVAEWWLEKYGGLKTPVEFFFLDDMGNVTDLKRTAHKSLQATTD